MSETIQYAYRVDDATETPCHLSEIKKGNVFYFVNGSEKSALMIATADAFYTELNEQPVWSIPHEKYE